MEIEEATQSEDQHGEDHEGGEEQWKGNDYQVILKAEPKRSNIWDIFSNLFFCLSRLCCIKIPKWDIKETTHSEDLISMASSSSTSPQVGDCEGRTQKTKANDYDVFLSFRGEDTRKDFTDHLYHSLLSAGFHTFRDNEALHVGEEIGEELLCCIKQSKISIPIISKHYASSKWCLRELTQMLKCKMLKCKKSGGHIVLPIYYKVEPSQLRHRTGNIGDAIKAHKKKVDKIEVKDWEEALEEVGSLKGWESEKVHAGHEGALIKIVVNKVMSELKRLFKLIVPKQLVGVDYHVEQIMKLVNPNSDGTNIIGIHGMSGIGKTTLAKMLYNESFSHFNYHSFVANIRDTSQLNGIESAQKQLISDITGSSCEVSNVDEGINIIKSRFMHKKILILLDDIDENTHLDALAGDGSWFKEGSTVIITTRNKSILDRARAGHMYQLNELPLDQSLILFSKHAFRNDYPPSNYEIISREIVSTTAGLPLALEIIGSFLCGKREAVWKDTLKKLKKVPHKEVQKKLRISYDALDEEEQCIFLDIACFFSGMSKQSPIYMWDACNFSLEMRIEDLSLLSLIKFEDGKIVMHDQLRDLGRAIVCQKSPMEPQKHSRLWIYEEAVDVLVKNKGTSEIQALRLNKYDQRTYSHEQFKELTNLRFLQVNGVNLDGNFWNLLPQLRWLWWERCPSDFAATNFHPEKLVVLDLSWSTISEDWGGWALLKMATKLKVLNLSYCRSLTRTPDFSVFESLEILNLERSSDLNEIHPSLGDVKTLISLNVKHCIRLKELPAEVGRMEELKELILYDSAIKEIPISRGCLTKLEILDATLCEKLAQLPEFMDSLVSLTKLNLDFCPIASIPSSIGHLPSLEQLSLHGCWLLREIPDSIGQSKSLIELDLKWTAIPEFPERIGNLHKRGSWTYVNSNNKIA